jgi:hypothetical protein
VLQQPAFRDGEWRLLECAPAWDGNWTADCFVAWFWKGAAGDRWLVAVNYAANQSQCHVRVPLQDLGANAVRFDDLMGGGRFDREKSDLDARGLYLDVPAWGYHVFSVSAPEVARAGERAPATASSARAVHPS